MGTRRKQPTALQDSPSDLGYSELKRAEHVTRYVLDLEFEDGLCARVDLKPLLSGPVFEPLRSIDAFKAFQIDEAFGVLCWPSGADIAPETLYEIAKRAVAEPN